MKFAFQNIKHILLLSLAAAFLVGCGNSTVTYRVTFEATWSSSTHPSDTTANPHFSSPIGVTHNSYASFWKTGEKATTGIQLMAERGANTTLRGEFQAAIEANHAGVIFEADSLNSPGSVSTTFAISSFYPLVTVVSMIAPSPDWFVGVRNLSLIENGSFVASKVVPLYAYDAGTDSGVTFDAANSETSPAENIQLLTGGDFGTAFGTLTFTRQ